MPFITLIIWLMAFLPAKADNGDITLWHAYRGSERDALEQIVDEWNKTHPNQIVVPTAVPTEAYGKKLETTIPRNQGPDLFIGSNEKIVNWAKQGLVQRVMPNERAFHPVTIDGMLVDIPEIKGHYGWPLAFKCLAFYVNTDIVSQIPQTTDELLEYAKANKSEHSWGLAFNATETYYVIPWLNGFGGGAFKDGVVSLNRQENANGMRYVKQLADLGPADPTTSLITQLFNEGKIGIVVDGPWLAGELSDSLNYQIVPLPIVSSTNKPAAPYATLEAVFLPSGAKNVKGATAFATYLAEDMAIVRATVGKQSVAYKNAWEDEQVKSNAFLQAFYKQLDSAIPMPTDPMMAQVWEPMNRAIRRVNRGATTPENAVSEAQSNFDIVTRDPPPPTNAAPFITVAVILVIGLVIWFIVEARKVKLRPWFFAYGWVGPAFLAMALLVVTPFIVGSGMSLFAHRDNSWTFVGLANFINILFARDWPITNPLSFYYTLIVTVVWTVINVFLAVSIGMGLALILREPWIKIRAFWRVLFILPWAVPSYITALMWKGLFHRELGAINAILGFLGIEQIGWFDSFLTAFTANLTTNTWLGFPFMMVVTLGALQAIPRDLEEAAELDGANAVQRFKHVILPLLKPALLPAIILGSVWTFNQFNVIYLVSGGEPDGSTEILISEAYRWAFTRDYRFGYAAAYAVLVFGTLLIYGRFTDRLKSNLD